MQSTAAIEQLAGKCAARAARRRLKGGGGADARPHWWNYVMLGVIIGLFAAPLYYALLLVSSDADTIARTPIPSLLPHGNLWSNLQQVIGSDINSWPEIGRAHV